MNLINKKAAPRSFVEYKKASNATYDDIDSAVKKDLQKYLGEEQKGICAYCQKRIKFPTGQYMKVEHHCEQSICDGSNGIRDLRLDYNNLFAVCLGGQGSEFETQYCDTRKNHSKIKKYLPIKIKPTTKAHIAAIIYRKGGTIESTNKPHDEEINEVLNLNIAFLKDERRKLYKNYLKKCRQNGIWNKEKLKTLVDIMTSTQKGLYQHNFPGLSTFLLEKYG